MKNLLLGELVSDEKNLLITIIYPMNQNLLMIFFENLIYSISTNLTTYSHSI